jgi:hypothetical protein
MSQESAQPEDPERYVGMAVEAARQRAAERGWRTVRVLPPDAVITMEYLVGRINLIDDGGTVSRCWTG